MVTDVNQEDDDPILTAADPTALHVANLKARVQVLNRRRLALAAKAQELAAEAQLLADGIAKYQTLITALGG